MQFLYDVALAARRLRAAIHAMATLRRRATARLRVALLKVSSRLSAPEWAFSCRKLESTQRASCRATISCTLCSIWESAFALRKKALSSRLKRTPSPQQKIGDCHFSIGSIIDGSGCCGMPCNAFYLSRKNPFVEPAQANWQVLPFRRTCSNNELGECSPKATALACTALAQDRRV